jgi:hypothetical protein
MRSAKLHLQHCLLDLLVDGPSSFAAIFGSLTDFHEYVGTGATVDAMIDAFSEMKEKDWVRSRRMTSTGAFTGVAADDIQIAQSQYRQWLPSSTREARSIDEIGLWYELLPAGRREWELWSESEGTYTSWVIDDDSASRTITINAATAEDAEEALSMWASRHPDIEVDHQTRVISSLTRYVLRSGEVLADGVTLKCRYRA